jgi:hypothetical protein
MLKCTGKSIYVYTRKNAIHTNTTPTAAQTRALTKKTTKIIPTTATGSFRMYGILL